jgi:two-component system, OmpR family, alkaline phosphatase synthesis response regulator PhoP
MLPSGSAAMVPSLSINPANYSRMNRRVLIVEDEHELANVIKRHLEDLFCTVQLAFNGDAGLRVAESSSLDLILLDIMLPGMDGLEVCRRLRARRVYTPVLMLTARATEMDKVLGLEMGADDYLTKPFSVAELTARIKAIFRRVDALSEQARGAQQPLRFGDTFSIDPRSREVLLRGRALISDAQGI